jgi:hypothetical protein
MGEEGGFTSDYFVDIIEDEVHEGVVSLQRSLDCEWTLAI